MEQQIVTKQESRRGHNTERFERIALVLACIFLALCFASSVYMAYRTSAYIFDSDSSSELILSEMLAEEGGILSKNWYYSSELRVLNTQLIYAPLFRIFDSWRTVRWVGQSIMNVILVLCYLFCAKQAGIRRYIRIATAGLLLLPLSTSYARIVLMHGYYIPHISIMFGLVGLLLMAVSEEACAKKRLLAAAGIAVLGVLSGLGGVRQVLVSGLPMLMAGFVLLFLSDKSARTIADYNRGKGGSLLTAMKTIGKTTAGKGFFLSLLCFVSTVVGYLINAKILTGIYAFNDYSTINLRYPTVTTVKVIVWGILDFFGFRERTPIGTAEGIAALMGMVCFLCCAAFTLRFLLKKSRPEDYRLQTGGLLFVITAGALAFTMMMTQKNESRFLLPAMGLLPLHIAAVWEQADERPWRVQRLFAIVMVLCCVANGFVIDNYLIGKHSGEKVDYDSSIVYGGLPVSDVDFVRDAMPVAKFLEENGYQYGYSKFWYSNAITELTEGKIEIVLFQPGNWTEPELYHWLTKKDTLDKALDADRVFLLLEHGDCLAAIEANADWLPEGDPVFETNRFRVYDMPADNVLVKGMLERPIFTE